MKSAIHEFLKESTFKVLEHMSLIPIKNILENE